MAEAPSNYPHVVAAEDRERYQRDLDWLRYAVHEIPVGVLWGPNGASAEQCAELMAGLLEFERICVRLNYDQATFIDACRWHFEHYPHYLERRRHFVDYATYISDRGGPMTVPEPSPPGR